MKTPCPISMTEFMENAPLLRVLIEGGDGSKSFLAGAPKVFQTGSFGWHLNGKHTLYIGGKPIIVQFGANAIIWGSKEAPRGA